MKIYIVCCQREPLGSPVAHRQIEIQPALQSSLLSWIMPAEQPNLGYTRILTLHLSADNYSIIRTF